jgi:DNA (cytosine-5)-methyltransferase 1
MSRPRLLDLFCGAGGAGMGYHRAGFDVVGVDINPQPHYPFEFHQADALTFPLDGFDAIHASPPCQVFVTRGRTQRRADRAPHLDLVPQTRARLEPSGVPWVMENVATSSLRRDLVLCGSMFGLKVRRHRHFESPFVVPWTLVCNHTGRIFGVYGHGAGPRRERTDWGTVADWRGAMGIDWMTRDEITQAIPPAYTEWIGAQLLRAIEAAA